MEKYLNLINTYKSYPAAHEYVKKAQADIDRLTGDDSEESREDEAADDNEDGSEGSDESQKADTTTENP